MGHSVSYDVGNNCQGLYTYPACYMLYTATNPAYIYVENTSVLRGISQNNTKGLMHLAIFLGDYPITTQASF